MIVVAIIAMITAIAVPSYQNSIRKTNRADGMTAMLDTQQRLERCMTTYGAYNHASCPVSGSAIVTPKGHYTITLARTASTYTITATPESLTQLADASCDVLTLDNTGKKGASGTTPAKCW